MSFDHKKLEQKWRVRWERMSLFSPDMDKAKNPFYNLMMFPYPSGEGLHVGHTYAFGGADAYGRFMRLQGYDVFEPMGFDAFGIHSENFAIKKGMHPSDLISQTTEYFREKQMKRYGGMWDWSRQVDTTDPKYYQWTQWLFVQMFKHGLAERKKAPLNWCPSCKTVLSDEQVESTSKGNVCERCKNQVERQVTKQWFFKITQYADRLLNYHTTKWPSTTREMQKNWIGKKEGIDITYPIKEIKKKVTCFTTRPDTNFGATFIVIAPEHELVSVILENKKSQIKNHKSIISAYVKKAKQKSDLERIAEGRAKTGVFTGLHAINQLNGREMPVYISDFVLMNVGTGAVVGVPGHDLRDFEFAQKFDLPIIRVVVGPDGDSSKITKPEQVQEEKGTMVNSEFLNGMNIYEATKRIMDHLEEKGWGKRTTSYRLRDWCISRQRYWGPPIPMIYCEKCAKKGDSWFTTSDGKKHLKEGKVLNDDFKLQDMAGWYPVCEDRLPVELPELEDYQPKGEGQSPLAEVEDFSKVRNCYCGHMAQRETDVSDTFLDSSWYFLRYPSTELADRPFDKKRTKKWLPVDMYIGGNEHAVLHLLYSRFVTMALYDMEKISFQEPFKRFFAHGLIIKDGNKMSKSRGNVINPEDYIDEYGADALRMYLLFLGPYTQGGDFRDSGMQGMHRFLQKVHRLSSQTIKKPNKTSKKLSKKLHQTIKKMTSDLEKLKFNTAIASFMELVNVWQEEKSQAGTDVVETIARLINPFAPFLSEEIWEMAHLNQGSNKVEIKTKKGQIERFESVLQASWPKHDPEIAQEKEVEVVIQVNGKIRGKIVVDSQQSTVKRKVVSQAKLETDVKKHLKNKKIKKTVFVPGKLVNFVV